MSEQMLLIIASLLLSCLFAGAEAGMALLDRQRIRDLSSAGQTQALAVMWLDMRYDDCRFSLLLGRQFFQVLGLVFFGVLIVGQGALSVPPWAAFVGLAWLLFVINLLSRGIEKLKARNTLHRTLTLQSK